jgi:hypothetical protein
MEVMSPVWSLVLGSLLVAANPEKPPAKPQALRYLRLADAKFVLESEVTQTRTRRGTTYVSRTEHPKEQMTLTLQFDQEGKLVSAEAVLEVKMNKRSAVLTFKGGRPQLKRAGGVTDFIPKLTPNAVVTTAPDWSDIFQLVRRYDRKKGGKQEFAGLWIHPVQPAKQVPFTIENEGKDTMEVKDKKVSLDRFKIHIRSGTYVAWADGNGRVYKLMVPRKPATAVVLEGYQDETHDLGK